MTTIIYGTDNADTIIGGAPDDTIDGLGGDDYIDAAGGSNLVYGGLCRRAFKTTQACALNFTQGL